METITRIEAMKLLGIRSRSAFHSLKERHPRAFIVVKKGSGRDNLTEYEKEPILRFIEWRKEGESFKP